MTAPTAATLTRKQIKEVFARNRGQVLRLAKELDLTHTGISLVLRGKSKSARVLKAAERRALELLEQEQRNA